MENLIDNKELTEVMGILEEMSDEQMAVTLLKKLNDATKKLGELVMNQDPDLDHLEWKAQCDEAKDQVDKVIQEIKNC